MGTKTIAVDERVWQRLKEIMKQEKADSLGDAVARLLDKTKRVPPSMFGVDKRSGLRFSQKEHEEITKNYH